jgi:hypothetical protein
LTDRLRALRACEERDEARIGGERAKRGLVAERFDSAKSSLDREPFSSYTWSASPSKYP